MEIFLNNKFMVISILIVSDLIHLSFLLFIIMNLFFYFFLTKQYIKYY